MSYIGPLDFFLDSGAFSVWTKGATINIDDYIAFIKANEKYLTVYANLDVLNDGEGSYRNWKYMCSKGLKPLPVFHASTDTKYLELYLKETDYIAIGAIAKLDSYERMRSLDRLWHNYLVDDRGFPKLKVHGFGLTSLVIMARYPWFSVDSTSAVLTGVYGALFVPRPKGAEWMYDAQCWRIFVSHASPYKKDRGKHVDNLTAGQRKILDRYLEETGFVLGKSEFKDVPDGYELAENEKWCAVEGKRVAKKTRKAKNKNRVEIVVESGLSNDYKQRVTLNFLYFKEMERSMPEWPWAWSMKHRDQVKGFGL